MYHIRNNQSIHITVDWFMYDKTFCWKKFTVAVTRGREKVIFDDGSREKVIPSLGAVKR